MGFKNNQLKIKETCEQTLSRIPIFRFFKTSSRKNPHRSSVVHIWMLLL